MRITSITRFSLLIMLVSALFSCTEKKEELSFDPIAPMIPLQSGKYITYRLDSLVVTAFNLGLETHSYQVKHVVDQKLTDNLGRESWRVYRYLNNAAGNGDWVPNGSYMITPTENQIEVVENNLRFIKLKAPLREGYTWDGNKFFPTDAYEPFGYSFGNDNNIQNWDYTYSSLNTNITVNGQQYKDVTTVDQQDYSFNLPVTANTIVATRNKSVEKYSKGIGLVYREYILWEYQGNPSGPAPAYTGFGITMWMIDHN